MFAVLAIVVICLLFLLYQIKFYKRNVLLSKFPSPNRTFLFEMINLDFVGFFNKFEEFQNKFGEVFLLSIHPFDCGTIFVNDPAIAEPLSFHQPDRTRSIAYKSLGRWIGSNGYFLSSGERLKNLTKPVTLHLHVKHHEKYAKLLNSHYNEAMEILERSTSSSKKQFDANDFVKKLASDLAFDIIYDFKLNAKNGERPHYLEALSRFFKLALIATYDPRSRGDFLRQFRRLHREETKALKILSDFVVEIIRNRRLMIKEDIERESCLVDYYIQNPIDKTFMADEEIASEMNTMFLGMHDSTQCASAFIFHNLAKYQDIQQKVYEEAFFVLNGDAARDVTEDDVARLPYMEAFIKETLRMFPPLALIGRKLRTEITTGGYTFPKDVEVVFSPYLMGRNPKYFKDPLLFNPDRFFGIDTLPPAYIPFGIGAKKCIGGKMSNLALKISTAKMIMNYKFTLPEGQNPLTLYFMYILKTKEKILINWEQRNENNNSK